MSPTTALHIAQAFLGLHIASALFIIAGAVLIPLGMRAGWRFIDVCWWRVLHVGALGIVVYQKLLGQTCFLSVWENHFLAIARHANYPVPLIHSMGDRAVHIPLPLVATTVTYSVALIYLFVLWYLRPPHCLSGPEGSHRRYDSVKGR